MKKNCNYGDRIVFWRRNSISKIQYFPDIRLFNQIIKMETKVVVRCLLSALILMLMSRSEIMGQVSPINQKLVVGGLKIQKLEDARIYLDLSLLSGIDHRDAVKLTGGRDSILTPVNAFLIQTPKHVILVDAGIGKNGEENSGHLIEQMNKVGIDPAKVDLILITHFHFDHIGGLVSPDGKRLFPNAIVRAPKTESDFWLRDLSLIPDELRARAVKIKSILEPSISQPARIVHSSLTKIWEMALKHCPPMVIQ